MVHAYNASAGEAEAEGWLVQSYARMHSKMVLKNSGEGPLLRTKYLEVNVKSKRIVKFKGRQSYPSCLDNEDHTPRDGSLGVGVGNQTLGGKDCLFCSGQAQDRGNE